MLRTALLFLGAWSLLGVLWVLPTVFDAVAADEPLPWQRLLPVFIGWQIWGVLTPFVLWVSRRFPLDRGVRLPSVFVHLGAAAACALVDLVAYSGVRSLVLQAVGRQESFPDLMRLHLLQGGAAFDLLLYAAIAAGGHAFEYYRRYRDREVETSQLEARLIEAQLQVLKMQLHPHFLFNTLNSISSLMHRDVEAADRMIALLSDLLRMSLQSSAQQVVPLEQELAFLERYLEIETTRFPDRLRVGYAIEPAAREALVPNLLLQPLVENAIRHGIALRSAPGRVEVRAGVAGGRLRLEVQDDGPGMPGSKPAREGIGLSNTRVRLAQLYGEDHTLEVRNAPRGGLLVRIVIPFSATEPVEERPLAMEEKTGHASSGRR
jgi:signal transduction histidine kinase